MKILVTGGGGKIGRCLCKSFRQEHELRVIDLNDPKIEGVEFIKCDIICFEEMEKATRGMEAIFHLAAIPYPIPGREVELMKVNTLGTFHLLEAAAHNGIKKFVMSSSDSTLGFVFSSRPLSPQYLPIDENHPLAPQDLYGLSKLVDEEICKTYTRAHDMTTICLRHCWVLFPEEFDLQKQDFAEPHSERNAKRLWAYIDVKDVLEGYRLALESEGLKHEALFLAAPNTYVTTPTLELIGRHFPQAEIWYPENVSPCVSLIDTSRARSVLGWQAKYTWQMLESRESPINGATTF